MGKIRRYTKVGEGHNEPLAPVPPSPPGWFSFFLSFLGKALVAFNEPFSLWLLAPRIELLPLCPPGSGLGQLLGNVPLSEFGATVSLQQAA